MALQLILELETIPTSTIELNTGVSCNCESLSVRREGVIGNGMVEKVVNFWSCHDVCRWLIGGALYYQVMLLLRYAVVGGCFAELRGEADDDVGLGLWFTVRHRRS